MQNQLGKANKQQLTANSAHSTLGQNSNPDDIFGLQPLLVLQYADP